MRFFLRLIKDKRGAAAIEYALIIGLVFLAMIVGLAALSQSNAETWNMISTKVSGG